MPAVVRKPDPHRCPWCAAGLPHPPRVHVRIDPVPRAALLALLAGAALILLATVLTPA